MNFADFLRARQQRFPMQLAGQGGSPPGGPTEDPNIICYEDGSCGPGYRQVGQRQNPNGWSIPPYTNETYGDGTGGDFVPTRNNVMPNRNYAASQSDQTGGPQPNGPPTSSPEVGRAFAQFLLNRMAGQGSMPIRAQPSFRPAMDPRNVICDADGRNCRPVYRG